MYESQLHVLVDLSLNYQLFTCSSASTGGMSPSPQAEGTVLLLGSSCTEPPRAPRCYHKSSQVLNLVKKNEKGDEENQRYLFLSFSCLEYRRILRPVML